MNINSTKEIKIVLVDDHDLVRTAFAALIDNFSDCKVIFHSANGGDLIEKLKSATAPDLLLLDLSMPGMDGFEIAKWMQKNYPKVPVLMLTMHDSEFSMIRLLRAGVKGFLKKNIQPDELKYAIYSVASSGYYYSSHTTGRLIHLFRNNPDGHMHLHNALFSDEELEFLEWVCSDLTYKEIAQRMKLKPRSVDTLREQLFNKLEVRSRVGLVMVAIKHGVVIP